jgi:hypothetical protein
MFALACSGFRRIELAGLVADTVCPGAPSASVFFSERRTYAEVSMTFPWIRRTYDSGYEDANGQENSDEYLSGYKLQSGQWKNALTQVSYWSVSFMNMREFTNLDEGQ